MRGWPVTNFPEMPRKQASVLCESWGEEDALPSDPLGFLVIWGLLSYLRRNDYRVFLAYRVGVAVLVFGLILTGVRSATL